MFQMNLKKVSVTEKRLILHKNIMKNLMITVIPILLEKKTVKQYIAILQKQIPKDMFLMPKTTVANPARHGITKRKNVAQAESVLLLVRIQTFIL